MADPISAVGSKLELITEPEKMYNLTFNGTIKTFCPLLGSTGLSVFQTMLVQDGLNINEPTKQKFNETTF